VEILRPYRFPIIIVGLHFLLFFLARLAILISYPRDFAGLTGGTIVWGFVRGVRFDAAIIFLVLGLPLLLLMLPFRWSQSRLGRGIIGWACFSIFILFIFALSADALYFGYVHRHVGSELTFLGEAVEAMALSAAKQYVLPLAAFVTAAAGIFWGWRKLMRLSHEPMKPGFARLAATAALLAVMYFAARGSVTGKRLKVIHAFTEAPPAAAYIALNGPFTALHSIEDTRGLRVDFYPWPEAMQTVKSLLVAPEEKSESDEFPLLRRRPSRTGPRPNVVLIMLEGWDAFYTDVYRRELGQPPLGLTPRFDALSLEGVRFSRFYACGQKSMDGMCALLCGFPTLPHTPYLGRGMEQSRLTFLGHLAKREGYETLFLQSSKRASFRNDAVSVMAGFRVYLGGEDITRDKVEASRSPFGGPSWDHEMFAEAGRRLAAAPTPFLAYLYTASMHPPFGWPSKEWEKFPSGSTEHRYKNSLGYVDDTLGRFFSGAKAAGYFDRTVFILTSDHVGCSGSGRPDDPASLHHVPCLILGGGLKPAVVSRIGSQLDVVPTIADLAGWGAAHATLGRSLFDETAPDRGACCIQGDLVLRIEDEVCVVHNLSRRLFGKGRDLDAVERRLLSFFQVAGTLLRQNRICPSQ
jgi:phosphoglycerol transferase MdoB-like AlkP superfamily enzyme